MTTNKAKANGFETEMEKAADAFEQFLTPQEEQEEIVEEVKAEEEEVLEEEAESDFIEDEEYDEEETEETEESAEDQVESEETEQPEIYTVNVDGNEFEVTQEELLKGYSRQSDYTKKTQALSEDKKNLKVEQDEILNERAIYKDLLPKLQTMLKQGLEQEPDWEALERSDPITFLKEKNRWNEQRQKLETAEAESARLHQEDLAAQNKQIQELIQSSNDELLQAIPEWKDATVASNEKLQIAKNIMDTYGFSQEEINQVYDHRLLLLMRDASNYKKASEAVKKKPTMKAKSRPARAGTVNAVKSTTPLKKAKNRLAKSGKVSDAAKVFEQLI